MRLWTDGVSLVIADSLDDVAQHLGLTRADIREADDLPIEILRQEIGPRAAQALVVMLTSLGYIPDRSVTIWRAIGPGEVVFLVDGRQGRTPYPVEDVCAQYPAGVLADRVDGHWVLR